MMHKAVFFDRDGVLNHEIGNYVCKKEDFKVLDDSVACIKYAKENGFKVIVITNQGGIDKGLYTAEDLAGFHQILQNACMESGTIIDDFYYCKHHPVVGNCLCRKPDSIMIEKAIAKHQIDKNQCFMIGDTDRDIDAATKAGIKSILIQPNQPKLHLIQEEIQKINNQINH
jgi:D-glycero-D-manno-heptose 1,7-bisphosphate phosphatase